MGGFNFPIDSMIQNQQDASAQAQSQAPDLNSYSHPQLVASFIQALQRQSASNQQPQSNGMPVNGQQSPSAQSGVSQPQPTAPNAQQQPQPRSFGLKNYLSNWLYGIGEAAKKEAGMPTDEELQQRQITNQLAQQKNQIDQFNAETNRQYKDLLASQYQMVSVPDGYGGTTQVMQKNVQQHMDNLQKVAQQRQSSLNTLSGVLAKFGLEPYMDEQGNVQTRPRQGAPGSMDLDTQVNNMMSAAGMTMNNLTPQERVALQFAKQQALTTGTIKPVEDFFNQSANRAAQKTNATIRVDAMTQARQYPVFDTKQNSTRYVSAEEMNRAASEEPGRYTVPSFTPEAITQQATGKTFAPGGKGGEEALAFQTAMQHADLLKQAANALNNGDMRSFNSVKNILATQFGDPDITNFSAIAHVYGNEIQKMITAGHITDAELQQNSASLPANANFATISKVLDSYKALAASKLLLRQQQQKLGLQGQSMVNMPQTPPQTGKKSTDFGFKKK